MAKRSPIAGYNHNVRYRGLIFHVQTEDSGQQSPHLFTHMFYGGVIISTRKLVYDSGSAEDAIKGLMQSQHKVVLRDLKRGLFDDKIDQYLAGTEGLLPRGDGGDEADRPAASAGPARDSVPRESSPVLQARMSEPEITLERSETENDITPEMMEPDEVPPPVSARTATPPSVPAPVQARTKTAERTSRPGKVRDATRPPPPPSLEELDPPTLNDSTASIAAAVAAANNATTRTQSPIFDSGPSLQFELELDDSDAIELPRRPMRDTDIAVPNDPRSPGYSDGVPARRGADSIQPLPPPPRGTTGGKISAVGAATLPPALPVARPPSRQALQPPAVVSRTGSDSDPIELYPSSVEPPPGAQDERPGQYSQYKRVSQRLPADLVKGGSDRSSPVAIPSGLSRPGRPSQSPSNAPGSGGIPQRVPRDLSPHTQTQPFPSMPTSARAGTPPRPATPSPSTPYRNEGSRPPERARTPTPARVSASSPTAGRSPSSQSGGVVMTRPAVIVGAPAKPVAPKVRKAREEEGRGFGQGLISEKSLDEVILAYLSEDAEEK